MGVACVEVQEENLSSEFEVQLSYSCHCFCLALCGSPLPDLSLWVMQM